MNNKTSKKLSCVKTGHRGSQRRAEANKRQIRKQQRKIQLDKKKELSKKGAYRQKQEILETIKKSSSVLNSLVASPEEKAKATACLHNTLREMEIPPVDEILATGSMKHFVNNLSAFPNDDTLITESLWALAKIAACGRFEAVVEANAVPSLMLLLPPRNSLICELAVWCLGSIAEGCDKYRDALVAYPGFMTMLATLVEQSPNHDFMKTIVWAISTILCNGKHEFEHVVPMISKICFLLKDYNHLMTKEIEAEMVRILSHVSNYSNKHMDFVMKSGMTAKLVRFIDEDPASYTTEFALKCLGLFAGGSAEQTAEVMDTEILRHVEKIMADGSRIAKKECCYLLSNIFCDKADYAKAVLKYKTLLPRVSNLAKNGPWEVKQEALWALAKLCSQPDDNCCLQVVRCEGFEPLIEYLGNSNAEAGLLIEVLNAVDRILEVDGKIHQNYLCTFEDYDGPEHLEKLQNHKSIDVYKRAVEVLENHFDVISDVEELEEDPAEENTGNSKDSIKRELFTSPTRTTGNSSGGTEEVFAVASNYYRR